MSVCVLLTEERGGGFLKKFIVYIKANFVCFSNKQTAKKNDAVILTLFAIRWTVLGDENVKLSLSFISSLKGK